MGQYSSTHITNARMNRNNVTIAKEIIELHEGRIEAESHDHTVTIKIYLPILCS